MEGGKAYIVNKKCKTPIVVAFEEPFLPILIAAYRRLVLTRVRYRYYKHREGIPVA